MIKVTWEETYKEEFGQSRYVYKGEVIIRNRFAEEDAKILIDDLQDPNRISIFDGRENRVENIKVERSPSLPVRHDG